MGAARPGDEELEICPRALLPDEVAQPYKVLIGFEMWVMEQAEIEVELAIRLYAERFVQ